MGDTYVQGMNGNRGWYSEVVRYLTCLTLLLVACGARTGLELLESSERTRDADTIGYDITPLGAVDLDGPITVLSAADWVRAGDQPSVVLGDLNTTPWSHALDPLEEAGLVSSQRSFGLQPTWPAEFWWLRLSLDHCFHHPDLVTLNRWTGPSNGSDHFALHMVLAFR